MSEAPWPPKIGAPATRALAAAGISSPQALAHWRESDLATLHGVGPRAIKILMEDLAARGLSLFEG